MIEVRDAGPDFWSASGWATTWSTASRPYFIADHRGTYMETVRRGAFADAVSGRDTVELRLEHDSSGPTFARTGDGSLKFSDMSPGLLLVGALSKADRDAQAAVEAIRARELTGLSVGMQVPFDGERWGKAADGRTSLRTITRATLHEVSLVRSPANKSATITDVRREQRSAGMIEYRSIPVVFRPVTLVDEDDTDELLFKLELARRGFR